MLCTEHGPVALANTSGMSPWLVRNTTSTVPTVGVRSGLGGLPTSLAAGVWESEYTHLVVADSGTDEVVPVADVVVTAGPADGSVGDDGHITTATTPLRTTTA